MRWASDVPGPAADDYGVSLAWVQKLARYWRAGYDWRAAEARLNSYPQFGTEIDGQDIHFLHVRSPEPGAIPLILTHGWPGSVAEFLNVIGPLTDPRAFGRDRATAFHLVIPSLPGFAFSAPLRDPGLEHAAHRRGLGRLDAAAGLRAVRRGRQRRGLDESRPRSAAWTRARPGRARDAGVLVPVGSRGGI